MEFEGEFTVDGTPDELWAYFTDPDVLRECAPGCEEMRLESPSRLTAVLAVGVGSVKPRFDVDAVVTTCDRPTELEVRATGSASRNSFEATAGQRLVDNGDGTTTVRWTATAQVSGIIASMGERALGSVADRLVSQFFADIEAKVNEGAPAESRITAAASDEAAEADAAEDAGATASTPAPAPAPAPGAADLGAPAGAPGLLPAPPVDLDVRSLAAGAGLGVALATLLGRSRGRDAPVTAAGDADDGADPDVVVAPATRAPPGYDALALVGAAALGALAALAWTRSSASDGTASAPEPTAADAAATGTDLGTASDDAGSTDSTGTDLGTASDDGVGAADGPAAGAEPDESAGDAAAEPDGTDADADADEGSDDPLDRLVSR